MAERICTPSAHLRNATDNVERQPSVDRRNDNSFAELRDSLSNAPWLQGIQAMPRPVSRRPMSNFHIDGDSSRCSSRDSSMGANSRRAYWKQYQQSMDASEQHEYLRPSTRHIILAGGELTE
eukprot:CAMPEP_0113699654 /NCGR_PEP_ID=MMETSP0038_2-20120614/23460_1 /TAXON_ID=2898 /ORGANISM="Cryptomonas paramecium" /LENGTH=121 /DNA_ID=CAMNT_0000623101 /DNA_START=281 /DNA_END=646 /DNA_ORIENTATION=+ /assembly_acc=CAM_ASM_000170